MAPASPKSGASSPLSSADARMGRGRRGGLAASAAMELLVGERPAQIDILRRPPVTRSEEDVDLLLSMCENMRWIQSEVKRPDDRRALVRILRYTFVGAGRTVIREGDRGNDMFLVLSGRLAAKTISRGDSDEMEVLLAEFGPGDHFGELALVNPMGTRAATVVTLEPSELLRIDRSDFQQVTRIGAKAGKMQANQAENIGSWQAGMKALHAAAFAGDTLGLERALMPETEAAMQAVSKRRHMQVDQRKLKAKAAEVPQLANRLTTLRTAMEAVLTEVSRVAKKKEQCLSALARAENKLEARASRLTEEEERVLLGNIAMLKRRLGELQQAQADNKVELAGAREVVDRAKATLRKAEEVQEQLVNRIERSRQTIVDSNAVPRLVDMRDTKGRTAAFLAAEAGHHGLLVMLQRHGAELHIADNKGVSPLHIACRRGRLEVVRYLLSLDVRRLVEVEDNQACFEGHVAVVSLLLEKHVDQINKPSSAGTTPVFACVDHGNLECVKLISERGEEAGRTVDWTRTRNKDKATPLYIACRHGDVEIVRWVAEHAPYSTREQPASDGTTPLAIAACQGHLGVVQYLASMGVNVEAANEAGNTPLHLAAAEGHLEVVKYLVVELFAPVHVENKAGVDAFQGAVEAGEVAVEVVGWLSALPTPPAVALKRTRLLQRKLRKGSDCTNPLGNDAVAGESEEAQADEARWMREEGERQERIEHREKSKAALAAGGGLWGALSAAAAGGAQGQATKNLIALIGQGSKEGEVTDAEILVELRAIEWDNLANGATVSEGGVTVAVRGGQLSAGQAYRRLLRARPEWGRSAVPELKERVASLCAKARGDAGQRWLRKLETEARDPSKQWAWTAPSAVFGEVLSTSAGVRMPGPGDKPAPVARPAGAISDWSPRARRSGTLVGSDSSEEALSPRPQGREAIAKSSMAAAEAFWRRMHPDEEHSDGSEDGASSRQDASSEPGSPTMPRPPGAGAGWGRLRGRRKGILQEDFTRHNIEGGLGGLEAESGPSPHSVGDKLKEMRAQAAVRFGGDDENAGEAQAEEEQPTLGRSFRRESRNMFVGRMHRKHIVPLRTMGSVADAAMTHRKGVVRAADRGWQRLRDEVVADATAAKRRSSVIGLARQRRKLRERRG